MPWEKRLQIAVDVAQGDDDDLNAIYLVRIENISICVFLTHYFFFSFYYIYFYFLNFRTEVSTWGLENPNHP